MANPVRFSLALALILPVPAWAQDAVTLRIAAEATVHGVPDEITLTVPVMSAGKSADEARASTAAKIAMLTAGLKARNVPVAALSVSEGRTMGFAGNVSFGDIATPEEVAPRATVTVMVKLLLADTSQLAAAQSALDTAGLTTMIPPVLGLRDDTEARAAAGKLAVAKARREAEVYADALGMRVLRIATVQNFAVSEGQDEMSQMARMMSQMQGGQAQDVETRVRVTVEYILAPR